MFSVSSDFRSMPRTIVALFLYQFHWSMSVTRRYPLHISWITLSSKNHLFNNRFSVVLKPLIKIVTVSNFSRSMWRRSAEILFGYLNLKIRSKKSSNPALDLSEFSLNLHWHPLIHYLEFYMRYNPVHVKVSIFSTWPIWFWG